MPGHLYTAAASLPQWLHGRHVGEIDAGERDARTAELLRRAAAA